MDEMDISEASTATEEIDVEDLVTEIIQAQKTLW